jgi:hypothetical protein
MTSEEAKAVLAPLTPLALAAFLLGLALTATQPKPGKKGPYR